MGTLRRQSIQSSILQYLGAAIGFANKILLFTNFMDPDQVGLANLLVNTGLLYAQFSAMGFSTVTLRFFPYFNDRARQHHNFLSLLMLVPAIGFVLVTLLVWVFQAQIVDYFGKNSPLMVEYFWYLVPLSFAMLYFELFDAYLRSLLKTVVPVLFREVIQRVFIALSISLYALKLLTFPQFVMVYVGLLSSVTLLMVLYTWWLGHLHFGPRPTYRMRMLMRKILVYGGFSLLGNFSSYLTMGLDGIMLAAYAGMGAVGIYTTSQYITVLIQIPWRAIQKVAAPKVAEHWKHNDMAAMQSLYQRTSLVNLGVGLFLFLSMVALQELMFAVMPPSYHSGLAVFLILGGGRVLDMLTGLNSYILLTSKYFRVDLLMSLVLIVTAVSLNMLLIPDNGIEGAAWATAITLTISNLFRIIFLWVKFRLQPFSLQMLPLILIASLSFGGCLWVQNFVGGFVGIGSGYVIFLVLFCGACWWFRVIPEANAFLASKAKLWRF